MIRTQLYITEQERQALRHLTVETGKSQSELIRIAIDQLVAVKMKDSGNPLKQAAGIWANKKNFPDFTAIRKEFDRF